MRRTDLFFLATAFLILAAVLLFFGYKPVKGEGAVRVCEENAKRECYVGKCVGEQRCVNNQWTECYLNIICIPNTIRPCVVDYCVRTYKICNECGTNYSECLPRNELPFVNASSAPP